MISYKDIKVGDWIEQENIFFEVLSDIKLNTYNDPYCKAEVFSHRNEVYHTWYIHTKEFSFGGYNNAKIVNYKKSPLYKALHDFK